MNFLEARRILAEFPGGPDLPFLFGLSGTADPFKLYLEAAAAQRGFTGRPRFLPFNTLPQHLAEPAGNGAAVYFLLPWDFVPEADWRSGVPASRLDVGAALSKAEEVAESMTRRRAAFLFLPAPIPPVAGSFSGGLRLERGIESIAFGLGATPVDRTAFSLGSYFGSGCPIGGASVGDVAQLVLAALGQQRAQAKVLVTDLDNTLWAGVIAEDGTDGIDFRPEGRGYRHYVYQTLLARFRREGTVLAALSRNDPDVVRPPFRSGAMPLKEEDFVAISASYHAKSAQIRLLADQLNLGLDSFVFVDDNPVEREEVKAALPDVTVLPFPSREEDVPGLLADLARLFERPSVTAEDQERTELYRRRLEGMVPADAAGADLTRFLHSLEMRLSVHDRTAGSQTRAVQLINKTNQFNANGRRWTEPEIQAVLDGGGRLVGASLADRTGSHGEIIACLIAAEGTIEAFVMSCRVFQRRVEHAFLSALSARGIRPADFRFAETERNEPFRRFIQGAGFGPPIGDRVGFDAAAFAAAHDGDMGLFEVSWD